MVGAKSTLVVAVALLSVLDGVRMRRKAKSDASTFSGCGVKGASAPNMEIVNGEEATECEWRWQASLRRSSGPFCGGTLITPEYVLTAAHCVSKANFDVVLGDHNTSKVSKNQQTRKAQTVWRHPGYTTSPPRNDYAIVKLESPVSITDCVGVACLPEQGADIPAASKCWITGWGTLSSGGRSPQILQEAAVSIISNDDCSSKFGYERKQIDESMICAQGRSPTGGVTDGCQGDSGGPLVCENGGKWTVHGATSWGNGCASSYYPGIWARVHEVLPWIDEILSGTYEPPTKPPGPCPDYCNESYCIFDQCMPCGFCP